MAVKKTLKVADIVAKGNHFLKHSYDIAAMERVGVAHFLETILHMADAYNGYVYLTEDAMKTSEFGKSIGIIHGHDQDPPVPNVYPDETRRQYWIKDTRTR